ncbi:MAG: HupE/UreJ family protein [Pseudorhodobacter sp.]|nr:HupE/UreJ family protein [Pseudorhodobacter sp.]
MKRLIAMLTVLPSAALAHAGHDQGAFSTGFAHPFGGADHLLAMVALGLWAAQAGGRAAWALPCAFVAAMLAGAVAGASGLGFPAVEPVILASVVLMGGAVAMAARRPVIEMAALAALFGFAHGWAHGAEGPVTGLAIYMVGFALATAGLHLAGVLAGRVLARNVIRLSGALTGAAGLALVVLP